MQCSNKWMRCSQRKSNIVHTIRQSVIHLVIYSVIEMTEWFALKHVGRQLKLKRSLENEFCSTTLGTSFSLLFCLANNPNNAMLKVLHCIPCSFRTISA